MVLWELTHIKPSTNISEFRAHTHVDMYARFRAAHERALTSWKIDGNYHRKVADSNK